MKKKVNRQTREEDQGSKKKKEKENEKRVSRGIGYSSKLMPFHPAPNNCEDYCLFILKAFSDRKIY